MKDGIHIFWFRRDLRLEDNAGLYYALRTGKPVIPIFIFDKIILDQLEDRHDRRVTFIYKALQKLQSQLLKIGSSLEVYYGNPPEVIRAIISKYNPEAVFTNHDYEPYAKTRDHEVAQLLDEHSIVFKTFKDQVIFEKDEVVKEDEKPYTVFTPYSRKWKSKLDDFFLRSYPTSKYHRNFYKQEARDFPSYSSMNFVPQVLEGPSTDVEEAIFRHYHTNRDFPGRHGTSRLGVHLRFGTISLRDLARKVRSLNEVYLNELIWREFYQMILWHFPRVGSGHAFKPEYEKIEWRNSEAEFQRWCEGTTGYPIVDAGMRELNSTGFMHNRVRMIVASFLCKHLLIDWRWGEAYFAARLLDFDQASNNGGWQWASGSGCDAAPFFRIFNPYIQTKKFDPMGEYIGKWVPELNAFGYPQPIVEHVYARKRCLEVYGKALRK